MAQNEINRIETNKVNFTATPPVDPQAALIDATALRVNEKAKDVIDSHIPHAETLKNKSVNSGSLGHELIQLGLNVESVFNKIINGHLKEIEKNDETISLLLKLNNQLSDAKELPDNIKATLDELKNRQIDFNVTIPLTKDQISTVKSKSQQEISKLSKINEKIFSTEVSTKIEMQKSIMNIVQEMSKQDNRSKEKANQLPRH